MKVITFLNNKGGVGKSASIVTVGHLMAKVFQKRTLLVDIDPQANTSQLFGCDPGPEEYSLKEMINGTVYPMPDTIQELLKDTKKDPHDCIYETEYENLDIIPSYLTLSNVENELLGKVTVPQQFLLKLQLEKIKDEYDFCLIDCGPSVSLLNVNALTASDIVYIPAKCDRSSRVGIANVYKMIESVREFSGGNLEFGGCFLTQYDARKKICREAWEDCKDALGDKLIDVTIPVDTKVEQTGSMGKPLYEITSKGNAAQSYYELTKLILRQCD